MLTIRASSLPTFALCQLKWAGENVEEIKAAAAIERPEILTNVHIGAAYGTALHAAAAYMLETGRFDQSVLDIAIKSLLDQAKAPNVLLFDDHTTKDLESAKKQLVKPLEVFYYNYASKFKQKGIVERYLEAWITDYTKLTGHIDHSLPNFIDDYKFGIMPMKFFAQLGGYQILDDHHEQIQNARDSRIISIPRTKHTNKPEFWVYHYDWKACKQAAFKQLDEAERAHKEWTRTKKYWSFNCNPNHDLCKKRFCNLYGTTICNQWHTTAKREINAA